ncbi:unnamed protein product [Trichogramma brassicae]|uniref:Uncharacterized protein n=1 Tax=Trichogramma brassicae TaxID=86971 RepID=A0A6H5IMK2_9HYME|nr:unnamed protein product [Trichogramma brassicae]
MELVSECLSDNCTRSGLLLDYDDAWSAWDYFEYRPWLFSIMGSVMVGLSGVFPLLVIPIDEAADLKTGDSAKTLKILLSFAVGGLLGDVFLHLLPEAWEIQAAAKKAEGEHASMSIGIWVLVGFFLFVVAEKLFNHSKSDSEIGANDNATIDNAEQQQQRIDDDDDTSSLLTSDRSNDSSENNNGNEEQSIEDERADEIVGLKKRLADQRTNGLKNLSNGVGRSNGKCNGHVVTERSATENTRERRQVSNPRPQEQQQERPKDIAGYLNLLANFVDNFTHGVAVGGGFLVSFRLGALTTFAILVHEIPHEIGDFAILLKSGFSRWDATKAQLMTATGGVGGALFAVISGNAFHSTNWILPFTAGGFLHIGLVSILPELVQEKSPKESLKQMSALFVGIVVMASLTMLFD